MDFGDCDNWRGTSLHSIGSEIHKVISALRLRQIANRVVQNEQNGFRPMRGTVDSTHALRRLMEIHTHIHTHTHPVQPDGMTWPVVACVISSDATKCTKINESDPIKNIDSKSKNVSRPYDKFRNKQGILLSGRNDVPLLLSFKQCNATTALS